jgi:hypothetical protein
VKHRLADALEINVDGELEPSGITRQRIRSVTDIPSKDQASP